MSQNKVSIKRHIAKTISYRILGSLITVSAALIIGLPISIASLLGFSELLLKPLAYFLHERIWYKWFKYGVIEDNSDKIF